MLLFKQVAHGLKTTGSPFHPLGATAGHLLFFFLHETHAKRPLLCRLESDTRDAADDWDANSSRNASIASRTFSGRSCSLCWSF
jgi:hypothetical protein